jgi:hypothetical protein
MRAWRVGAGLGVACLSLGAGRAGDAAIGSRGGDEVGASLRAASTGDAAGTPITPGASTVCRAGPTRQVYI